MADDDNVVTFTGNNQRPSRTGAKFYFRCQCGSFQFNLLARGRIECDRCEQDISEQVPGPYPEDYQHWQERIKETENGVDTEE